jgi:hypothetical protein
MSRLLPSVNIRDALIWKLINGMVAITSNTSFLLTKITARFHITKTNFIYFYCLMTLIGHKELLF